jgi:hypothetical protein
VLVVAEGSDQHELAHVSVEPFWQLLPSRVVGGPRWTLTVSPVALWRRGLLAGGADDHHQDQGHQHGDKLRPVGPAKLLTDGADQADGEEPGQGATAAGAGLGAWPIRHGAGGAATPGGPAV